MSINSSGKKLEGFFTGKGFYIVLFLCAAVIGLSAWMMAAGNETMENMHASGDMLLDAGRVETIIIPPQTEADECIPVVMEQEPEETEAVFSQTEAEAVWQEDPVAVESPIYIWPVQGMVDRAHDIENLSFDVTLMDWRTHDGVDICADAGQSVAATAGGTVIAVENDSLFGQVVSIDHGNGLISVYANLEESPWVSAGDWVEPGDIIGCVGSSALCEIGQPSHLHFAMRQNGISLDPMEYLPA